MEPEHGAVAEELFTLKRTFDILKMRLKRRLGWLEPVTIVPYRGYGAPERLSLRGRVLEDKELDDGHAEESPWRNLLYMYRRFESDEIPEALVRAHFRGRVYQAVTDVEGFFQLTIEPEAPLSGQLWYPIELELVEPKAANQGEVRATGLVLVPPPDAEFGIISDMDDTVIYTGATTILRQLRTVLFNNAFTRRPFAGVDAFYTALQQGPDERGHNPIFYVSSNAWNMYQLFTSILDLHDIPMGPLLLRDHGFDARKGISFSHTDHKLAQIKPIFDTYPHLPFVLVGDSGQKDPEIYQRIVEEYPGRVRAIYIRDVTKPDRDREVHAIAERLNARGVPLILSEDTGVAARHAVAAGLISPDALASIDRDRERDERRADRRTAQVTARTRR